MTVEKVVANFVINVIRPRWTALGRPPISPEQTGVLCAAIHAGAITFGQAKSQAREWEVMS